MSDGLAIIWAAAREVSAAEKRLITSTAREADARVRMVPLSSLARELVRSLSPGPVVVVVGSHKDVATAHHLGAHEVVHIRQSGTLRKSIIGGAIARARARARRRAMVGRLGGRSPGGDAFLIRVLEQRLGSPLDAATARCKGLADELKGAVAAADRLMQRVQRGAQRKGSKRWRGDVRDYARATLKAKALALELEKQVGVTNGVVKALDNLSLHIDTAETDVALVLTQLAEFLGESLPEGATLEVHAPAPCVVSVPRTVVVAMLSSAIECALFSLLESGSGRISLRASMISKKEIVVEIADDGAPASAFVRGSAPSPSFSDPRAIRLRQIRKRVRRAGGEMTVNSDANGNLLTLYLPSSAGGAASSSLDGSLRARSRRIRRSVPLKDGPVRGPTRGR